MKNIDKTSSRGIFRDLDGDRGSAMLIAMMIVVILTLVGISFMILSDTENKIAINERDFEQVLYIGHGAAKIVENWFNMPDPAFNATLPTASDMTLNLRRGDSDFDGYYGDDDTDGVGGEASIPEIDATVRTTDYYKGGNATGVYRFFDRPFRSSRQFTFWGTRDNPEILIVDEAGVTDDYIDKMNQILNPQPNSTLEKKSLGVVRVREIRIYGPPVDTDQELRYGVATIEVTAAKRVNMPGGATRYVAKRVVREVIQEIPYPNPKGPLVSQGQLDQDSMHSGRFGLNITNQNLDTDGEAFKGESLARYDRDWDSFAPTGPDLCGATAGVQNMLHKIMGLAITVAPYAMFDPWRGFEARDSVIGAPNSDTQPWPHDGCADFTDDKSHFFQKVRISNPKPEYAIWKSIVSGSNHQKIRYFVETDADGPKFKERSTGKAFPAIHWINSARPGIKPSIFFFDTLNQQDPEGEMGAGGFGGPGLPSHAIELTDGDLGPDSGNLFIAEGFLYFNAEQIEFNSNLIDNGVDTRINFPGEPFMDTGVDCDGDTNIDDGTAGNDIWDFCLSVGGGEVSSGPDFADLYKSTEFNDFETEHVAAVVAGFLPHDYNQDGECLLADGEDPRFQSGNNTYPHEPFLNFAYPSIGVADEVDDPASFSISVDYNVGTQREISDVSAGGHDWDGDDNDDLTTNLRDPEGALLTRKLNMNGILYNFGQSGEALGVIANGELNFFGSLMVNSSYEGNPGTLGDPTTVPHIYYDERIKKGEWPPPELRLPRVYVSFMDTDEY